MMSTAFGPSDLSGVKVLVVDDDADTRDVYQQLLELCGASVTPASSASAGWEAFQDRSPDVVVSDIKMPGGSGYDLVRRIRARAASAGGLTPAIAVSASYGPEESLGAGFDAHLSKPVDPLRLVDVLRGFVREDKHTRSQWTVTHEPPDCAVLKFVGHPTANDMRAATTALAGLLETGRYRVVVDLRQITGFDLSVGNVAERIVWNVRDHITGATIVGGSFLARLVAKAACATLEVPCELVDHWRTETS